MKKAKAESRTRPSRPLVKPEKVPSGWYTRRELESAWGLSDKRTGTLISQAVHNGMAECRTFRIATALRGVYPTQHYRFKS